jgi:tRNA-uridine 2-sulfurtransferase
VQGHDHPWLLAHDLRAGNVSWVAGEPPADGHACGAKTRYRQADAPCSFANAGEFGEGQFSLHFPDAQWAVTPGQSAVLYDGEVCLGGGIIEAVTTLEPHVPAVLPPVAPKKKRSPRKKPAQFAAGAKTGATTASQA